MEIAALVADIVFLISLIASSIYGIIKHFKRKAVLFMQIITSAIICLTLGQLFIVVLKFTSSVTYDVNVGALGTIGCFFFLFSASFGQIDGLGDSKDKSLRKYRLIPLALPLLFLVCYVFICLSKVSFALKIVDGFIILVLSLATYYNLKHLILPDVDCGILQVMKRYNLFIIIIATVSATKLFMPILAIDEFSFILTFLLAGLCSCVIPLADSGVKKWFL